MKALGVVVVETTQFNYLIVIDRADIIVSFFGEVLIPEAVLVELRHWRLAEELKVPRVHPQIRG